MSGQGANTGARPQGAADALLGLSSGTIVNETPLSTLSTSASLRPASRMGATGAASTGATNGSSHKGVSQPDPKILLRVGFGGYTLTVDCLFVCCA